MKINTELIKKFKPCQDRMDNFEKEYPNYNEELSDFLQLDKITFVDKIWVSVRVKNNPLKEEMLILNYCSFNEELIFTSKINRNENTISLDEWISFDLKNNESFTYGKMQNLFELSKAELN